ncbi:MAG: hypothetical protein ACYDC3_13675, partial [Candidatus Binataceae bacterium]
RPTKTAQQAVPSAPVHLHQQLKNLPQEPNLPCVRFFQHPARVRRRSQTELFSAKVMSDSHYYDGLRDRYLGIAQKKVFSEIKSQRRVLYDTLWHIAAGFPLVWESDLKQWICEWVETKLIAPPRLASNQRVPQRGKGNFIVLRSPSEDGGGSR